jgi:putative flippase GtrA
MEVILKKIKNMRNNKEFIQLIKFGIVGISNTLVDFLVFTVMVYTFSIRADISQAFSYSAGTLNSFIFNKKWTFKANVGTNTKLQAIRFIIINGISLILSSVCVSYLIEDLSLNKLLAKIAVTLLTQVINYFGYKLIVFK